MNNIDLSPYLIDVFIQSQKVSDWKNSPDEVQKHIDTVETWWARHKTTGAALRTGEAYLMLTHLNMLKGYAYTNAEHLDWKIDFERLFRIKAGIIAELGQANLMLRVK